MPRASHAFQNLCCCLKKKKKKQGSCFWVKDHDYGQRKDTTFLWSCTKNKQKTHKQIGLKKKKLKIKGVLSFLKAGSKMKILYFPIYTESVKLAAKEM